MNAKKCDMCNKFYNEYNIRSFDCDPNAIALYQKQNDGIYYIVKKYDLCPECMAESQEWLSKREVKKN